MSRQGGRMFTDEFCEVHLSDSSPALLRIRTYDDGEVAFIAVPGKGEQGENAALTVIDRLAAILDEEKTSYHALRRGSSFARSGRVDALLIPRAAHRTFDLLAKLEGASPRPTPAQS